MGVMAGWKEKNMNNKHLFALFDLKSLQYIIYPNIRQPPKKIRVGTKENELDREWIEQIIGKKNLKQITYKPELGKH
jgi:hypothetical protein